MTAKDPQLVKLEQRLQELERIVRNMDAKISFLERENTRRKDNINTVAQHLNRK